MSRLPETKPCPMCGRRMHLIEERLTAAESEHTWRPAPAVHRYYQCDNAACEHVQRAA